jgi:segregation and condensation protein A
MQMASVCPSDSGAKNLSQSDFEEDIRFEAAADADGSPQVLRVDLDGYEGPLHVLLELSRTQKVDLRNISILELAEQYLSFIRHIQSLRIELAADYLVMAAWLTYLKSRLILPKPKKPEDGPDASDMAAVLAFRLQRLAAMTAAAKALMARDRTGLQLYLRGQPEGVRRIRSPIYEASIYDLLSAYATRRSRTSRAKVVFKKPVLLALEEARTRLERILGKMSDWLSLDQMIIDFELPADEEAPPRSSLMASSLVASLELAKEGRAELRQTSPFAPLYVRPKPDGPSQ